ncbi:MULTISPECIES: ABC transporter substrate-binding protein [Paenibacillus]|uniref:ABC transporter substrate-binding protein n=1 Tax=Paenibacillus TaxID=44249 RepID=UPI0015772896|nr:ABC transporter substrate-binding protein [Paenibacillus sp. JMULE4]NTZ16266.1 ABC transporter substrate-binding protein [Paenibacillus sp. JMULE4]
MKKWLGIGLIFVLTALAGCGVPTPNSSKDANQANPPSAAPAPSSNKEITVAANGGKIEKAIRDVIAPKFREETGIKVNFLSALSGEILSKVELQKNAPQLDVAVYVPLDVQRAVEKDLVEPLDEATVPNMKLLDSRFVAVDNKGVPAFGLVIAPAYNTKTFEQNGIAPITSWNDLIRAEYKGKTAYSDIANDWSFTTLYNLAFANGGSLDNMEPGLEKAKELARYSDTFYKNSTQMMPAMQQGAADVTVMGSYAIADLAESGVPLKMVIPKEGAPLQAFNATVVKNAPHKAEAIQFLNYLISEESQKLISESGFYPVLQGMEIPEKFQASIGIKGTDKVYRPDVKKLSEIRAAWMDRWTKEVAPELGKSVKK